MCQAGVTGCPVQLITLQDAVEKRAVGNLAGRARDGMTVISTEHIRQVWKLQAGKLECYSRKLRE